MAAFELGTLWNQICSVPASLVAALLKYLIYSGIFQRGLYTSPMHMQIFKQNLTEIQCKEETCGKGNMKFVVATHKSENGFF